MELQHIQPRTEYDMTTAKKIARRKLSLLELTADLGNVSKACRVMGYSRQQFYEIRRNFQRRAGARRSLSTCPCAWHITFQNEASAPLTCFSNA
jgi:transposase-like protein